jgi:hypothetical protein
VIVLDQHRIIESEAVVRAAAAAHRVFFQRAQAGQGFPRFDDLRFGMRDLRDVSRSQRGDAGEVAEEIERDALGGEDRRGRPFQFGDGLTRPDPARITQQGAKGDLRIDLAKRFGRAGEARDHARLASDKLSAGLGARRDGRRGGDVAGAA